MRNNFFAATPGTRYQILTLSGGGYRGLYSVAFLEACEEAFGTACSDKFDMMAGTSIGALLAAGLSMDIPAYDTVFRVLPSRHTPVNVPLTKVIANQY